MTNRLVLSASLVALAASLATSLPAQAQGEVSMKLIPSGAISSVVMGYGPGHVELSPEKPASITKLPPGLVAPLYGTMTFTPNGKTVTVAVIVDEPDGAPARIFLDTNGNGDLTDDPAIPWISKAFRSRDGKMYPQYSGTGTVDLPLDSGKNVPVAIGMYRFSKDDPTREKYKTTLLYFHDYARIGEATLGGKKYPVVLDDASSRGDFSDRTKTNFMIDVNNSGKFYGMGKVYSAAKPFNIGGTTYEITSIASDGSTFTIAPSKETVAEVLPPPEISRGKKALAFTATTTAGTNIDFPTAYKGKLVLLDFWATWCGPCKAELPKLTAAYQTFHPQGVEVLGISLDQKDAGAKLANFTKTNNMPWPQIYDGKFWDAQVAKLYNIHAIPAPILIDGDTGTVIAAGDELRGDKLAATLSQALAKRKAP